MEEKQKVSDSKQLRQTTLPTWLSALSIALHILMFCGLVYGAYYMTYKLEMITHELATVTNENSEIKAEMITLEKICRNTKPGTNEYKREVLSTSQLHLSSIQGPIGPPGPRGADGRDGLPGKDGTDFASLQILEGIINSKVNKEWSQLSNSLPTYGGVTYIRWGKKSCPAASRMIYTGTMAGPDTSSSGGGSNYQCLPSDPDYYISNSPSKALHSTLRPVQYYVKNMPDLIHLQHHMVPCTVCETDQRVTKLMIPAVTGCPTSKWQLEYKGYLMSEREHEGGNQDGFEPTRKRATTSYVCVDKDSEPLTSQPQANEFIWDGGIIFPVEADCTGNDKLSNCPPYRGDNSALACVVCSK